MIIIYWSLAVYLVALCCRVKWIRFAVKTWWKARAHRKWIGEWYSSRVLACCCLHSLGYVSLLWVRNLYQQILEYVWTAVPQSNRGYHPGLVCSTQRARRFGLLARISFDLAAPYLCTFLTLSRYWYDLFSGNHRTADPPAPWSVLQDL